jgi:hypothetical protein
MNSQTRFHITPYLRRQMDLHPPKLAFRAASKAEWKTWQQALREKLYELMSPWPEPEHLNPTIVEISEEADHFREEIIINSHENMEIPCTLLRPKEVVSPSPAIVALHGHGEGQQEVVGLIPSVTRQGYGLEMVREGYVVITLDFFPFGVRKETEHNAKEGYEYACNSTLIRTLLWGYSLLTLNVFDIFRTIDYLASRNEVDSERIGMMGLSYGGVTCMYASILNEKIKAIVLSCSLGEFRGHGIELDELCGAQVVRGILQWAEMGDIAGLLAPRPLLAENTIKDECFPWPYTEPTLKRLQEVYQVAGAADQLGIEIFDDFHRYYGESVKAFFQQHL